MVVIVVVVVVVVAAVVVVTRREHFGIALGANIILYFDECRMFFLKIQNY